MPETEEKIFETLCGKYASGNSEAEKRDASSHGVFPPKEHQELLEKKKNGTLHVCDYPFLEKEIRLKRRVALFYKKHVPMQEKGESGEQRQQQQQQRQKKIEAVLEMKYSEKEIFEKLCAKYNVDVGVEKMEAESIFGYPVF